MANDREPRPVVGFELDADEVLLPRLVKITDAFLALLREVDRDVAPGAGVQWFVETLSKTSPLRLAVRPEASNPKEATPALPRRLVETVNDGIRTVQEKAERPAHFTDHALERAKELVMTATLGDDALKMGPMAAAVSVDSMLIAHVDAILGNTLTSIGTVEGTLEGLNVHGTNRYFSVYDALTGERVPCHFGHRVPVDEIGAAVEKRVAVHGEIKYRETGEIVSITVQSFEVFPSEDALPSADDVRGILEG